MCYYIWNDTKTRCQKVLTFYWDCLYAEDSDSYLLKIAMWWWLSVGLLKIGMWCWLSTEASNVVAIYNTEDGNVVLAIH